MGRVTSSDPRLDIARHLLGGMITDVIDHLAITTQDTATEQNLDTRSATASYPAADETRPRAKGRETFEPSKARSTRREAGPDEESPARPRPFTERPVEPSAPASEHPREKLMRELMELDRERREIRTAELRRWIDEDML
jgi:hypothetical protein